MQSIQFVFDNLFVTLLYKLFPIFLVCPDVISRDLYVRYGNNDISFLCKVKFGCIGLFNNFPIMLAILLLNNLHENTVMGIKGRRVHMIEELSQTIISFQRGKAMNDPPWLVIAFCAHASQK